MPGHAVHIELASRSRDLFPEGDPVTNALYHGSLGPDMGMFPGGDSLVSDLAHYVRTADLARALVARATNEVERAYAWGWVAHIVADSGLHPAINRASGDIAWSESPEPHLRVEFGLDFSRLAQKTRLSRVRLQRMDTLDFVVGAYRDTYGLSIDTARLRRAHGMVTVGQRLLFSSGPVAARIAPLKWVARQFPGTVLSALTTPVTPEPWLLEELALALEEYPRRLEALWEGDLADLENLNLDSGAPASTSDREVERALQTLEERLAV